MKICLIGSTRFMDRYREVNRLLTLGGHVVYTVATISSSLAHENIKAEEQGITEDEKETLDLVHLLKIQNSDAIVLITDATGYVGFSTKREIKWALMIGKQVILPEHVKSFSTVISGFYDWLKAAIEEASPIDLKSKIKLS
jgi:uncharacterized NAD-dependent epimerase/dehydratase family protein